MMFKADFASANYFDLDTLKLSFENHCLIINYYCDLTYNAYVLSTALSCI